jgi:hypothetical protein
MEDLVEAGRELGVSVTQQESDRTCSFRKCRVHVASLLENPLFYRVRRDPCERRARHLATEHCHLMTKHDDLDGEFFLFIPAESNQLKQANECHI